MLPFAGKVKLKRWFGDFGGGFCADDMRTASNPPKTVWFEQVLQSAPFEQAFQEALSLILPQTSAWSRYDLDGGKVIVAPNLSWYYNLAGQLSIPRLLGKTKVYAGVYRDDYALCIAKACRELGLKLTLVLSRAQANNPELIEQLKALECGLDAETCRHLIDLPYAYAERVDPDPDAGYVMALEANWGAYPVPALVGTMAGIFGATLKSCLEDEVTLCVTPITTGTEAVGAFKAFLPTDCVLATCEEPIAQEYHITDLGAYTLSTRSAMRESLNTSLCPEMVDWWRKGRVIRLGCDTLRPVPCETFLQLGLNPLAARAAALARDRLGEGTMLVLEVK